MTLFDAIERWCAALCALGYDLDALAALETELRYLAGLALGRAARGETHDDRKERAARNASKPIQG